MSTTFTDNAATIPVPLTPEAHEYARKFAAEQFTPEKARRVYLGTLAIYAIHTYLRCIQVETDLQSSDSWSWPHNVITDGADLELPEVGKLECCPVLPGADHFAPPQIILPDRIIYVAVQFKEVLDEVELIGYRPIVDLENPPEEIYIDDIQSNTDSDDGYSLFPIENLSGYLAYVKAVRKGLEEAEQSFIAGVRQMLEEQMRSLPQLAVQAIYETTACPESAWGVRGEQLLVGRSSARNLSVGQRNTLSAILNDTGEEQASVTDEQLRTIGSQFLQWVRSKRDEVSG